MKTDLASSQSQSLHEEGTRIPKKSNKTIPGGSYKRVLGTGHVWTQKLLWNYFVGDVERHPRTQRVMNRLRKKGEVGCMRWEVGDGHPLIYWSLARWRGQPPDPNHGLACAHGLVAFWNCRRNPDVVVIGEAYLRGYPAVAEWAMLFPGDGRGVNKLLLFEYSTTNDLKRVSKKVDRYDYCIPQIEKEWDAEATVVWVVEGSRDVARMTAQRNSGREYLYFASEEDFKSISLGEHLKARIYYLSADGELYSLI